MYKLVRATLHNKAENYSEFFVRFLVIILTIALSVKLRFISDYIKYSS